MHTAEFSVVAVYPAVTKASFRAVAISSVPSRAVAAEVLVFVVVVALRVPLM